MKQQPKKEKIEKKPAIKVLDKGIDLKNGTREAICCRRQLAPFY